MPESPSTTAPLPRQRRHAILAALADEGAVRVSALAEQFGVAEETIRRDLDLLSRAGRLIRTHGGAVRIGDARYDPPVRVRRASHVAEKEAIARLAATLVEEGDVLALDASTTALALARVLPNVRLTVVTNGIEAIQALRDRPLVTLISTGGQIDTESLCHFGAMAAEGFGRFALTKAFLSCRAIDLTQGLSEASIEHAAVKQAMLARAAQAYVLADYSKIGRRSVAYFGELANITLLITDQPLAPALAQQAQRRQLAIRCP